VKENCVNSVSTLPRLIDFFRYFSRDFSYNTGVASIRSGLLKKESKGWQNDVGFVLEMVDLSCLINDQLSGGKYNDSRERNRLCIEVWLSPACFSCVVLKALNRILLRSISMLQDV
jgi:Cid1 family poly A polymerase